MNEEEEYEEEYEEDNVARDPGYVPISDSSIPDVEDNI